MAARVLHDSDGALDLGAAQDVGLPIFLPERAATVSRLITRAEREQRRAVFCELLKRRGTIAIVARAWGVSDAQVRRVRDGLAPLSDERLNTLPKHIRAAVEGRLAAPIQLRIPGL